MKKLFYETEEFLKEKVEKIESEIHAFTDDGAACCVSDDKGAYLVKLIEERKDTLDAFSRRHSASSGELVASQQVIWSLQL